jgi:hypothetical protein
MICKFHNTATSKYDKFVEGGNEKTSKTVKLKTGPKKKKGPNFSLPLYNVSGKSYAHSMKQIRWFSYYCLGRNSEMCTVSKHKEN